METQAGLRVSLPEGEGENSPGWSSRKRTQPWESVANTPATPRRGVRNSSPNVAWVVFNPVLVQECDELSLKITSPMVLFLAFDIRNRGAHLRPSNRKRAVAFLPLKIFLGAGCTHPVRGRALDLSHGGGYRQRRRQREKKVDVVFGSSDYKRLHAVFSRDAAHVGPQAILNLRRNRFAPLLGREDTMHQRTTIGA